jgi:hypothetical protein
MRYVLIVLLMLFMAMVACGGDRITGYPGRGSDGIQLVCPAGTYLGQAEGNGVAVCRQAEE